jgi:tRNA 2-thiocytidine biosynthesis protein TtcA
MDATTRPIWPPPPKTLLRAAGRAIADYDMIRPGDRILLALSGGKDSLALLHVLRTLQDKAPVRFELAAATVDPCIEGFDPSFLKDYVPRLGIPYFYERQDIAGSARTRMRNDSFCAYCARLRRGILYRLARTHGYNVLALAQHLDDLAESFFMSVMHNGRLRTMKAHYRIDAGDLRVIRPFVYVRERQTAAYAASAGLPAIRDNCPACFRAPTERARIKTLLAAEERLHPRLFASLLAAMRPLMRDDAEEDVTRTTRLAVVPPAPEKGYPRSTSPSTKALTPESH